MTMITPPSPLSPPPPLLKRETNLSHGGMRDTLLRGLCQRISRPEYGHDAHVVLVHKHAGERRGRGGRDELPR